jgi:hypothetical protein
MFFLLSKVTTNWKGRLIYEFLGGKRSHWDVTFTRDTYWWQNYKGLTSWKSLKKRGNLEMSCFPLCFFVLLHVSSVTVYWEISRLFFPPLLSISLICISLILKGTIRKEEQSKSFSHVLKIYYFFISICWRLLSHQFNSRIVNWTDRHWIKHTRIYLRFRGKKGNSFYNAQWKPKTYHIQFSFFLRPISPTSH